MARLASAVRSVFRVVGPQIRGSDLPFLSNIIFEEIPNFAGRAAFSSSRAFGGRTMRRPITSDFIRPILFHAARYLAAVSLFRAGHAWEKPKLIYMNIHAYSGACTARCLVSRAHPATEIRRAYAATGFGVLSLRLSDKTNKTRSSAASRISIQEYSGCRCTLKKNARRRADLISSSGSPRRRGCREGGGRPEGMRILFLSAPP